MSRSIKTLLTVMAFAVGLHSWATSTGAQEKYPAKPITILVGFDARGGVDATTRLVAKYAAKYWGADAIVVNKPGGGGNISWNSMLRSKPDGYTLAAGVIPNVIYQPAVRPDDEPGYEIEDLVQIGIVSRLPTALYVAKDGRWKTLGDLAG